MVNLTNALQQLRDERMQAQQQVEKLDAAISAIEGIVGRNSSTPARGDTRRGRTISAIARRRMARAQRARWARVREQSRPARAGRATSAASAKRTMSAAARRKIAAAQRARWARVRANRSKRVA